MFSFEWTSTVSSSPAPAPSQLQPFTTCKATLWPYQLSQLARRPVWPQTAWLILLLWPDRVAPHRQLFAEQTQDITVSKNETLCGMEIENNHNRLIIVRILFERDRASVISKKTILSSTNYTFMPETCYIFSEFWTYYGLFRRSNICTGFPRYSSGIRSPFEGTAKKKIANIKSYDSKKWGDRVLEKVKKICHE